MEGSPSISTPVMTPSAMVRTHADRVVPPGAQTAAGRPSTYAAWAAAARPLNTSATASRPCMTGSSAGRPEVTSGRGGAHRERVRSQLDVGVEHREKALEAALPGGLEEGVDDLALAAAVGLGLAAADLAPGAGGELAGVGRAGVDDRRHLVEGNPEEVVQHEGQPLGRAELVEHHQQGGAHGVGRDRLLGRIRFVRIDRLRHLVDGALPTGGAGLEGVEADPRHDGGQPAVEVVDAVGLGAVQAQPRLLHRVVGGGVVAEHPHRHRVQPRAGALEPAGQRLVVGHVPILPLDPCAGSVDDMTSVGRRV